MERASRKKYSLKKKVVEWVAWLIGKGHANAFRYGINFFRIAVKESYHQDNERMVGNAAAHRISKMDSKDYAKTIENILPSPVDHHKNLEKYGRKHAK